MRKLKQIISKHSDLMVSADALGAGLSYVFKNLSKENLAKYIIRLRVNEVDILYKAQQSGADVSRLSLDKNEAVIELGAMDLSEKIKEEGSYRKGLMRHIIGDDTYRSLASDPSARVDEALRVLPDFEIGDSAVVNDLNLPMNPDDSIDNAMLNTNEGD